MDAPGCNLGPVRRVDRGGVVDTEAHLKLLMLRALDGDAAAWRALLGALRLPLSQFFRRRMANAADIEDLVQETLIAVHAKRATFDRAQPFSPWLYAVARYKMIDALRRQGRRPTQPLDDLDPPSEHSGVEDGAVRHDLARLLAVLPARQRRLIEDVRVGGLSMAEAAARHGFTEGAAKVSVHRGLKTLSRHVTSHED